MSSGKHPADSRQRDRKPRSRKGPPEPIVERLGPPISAVVWSPEVVAQTLEILAVGLRAGAIFWLKPIHADSLRVGLSPSAQPGTVVIDTLGWYALAPRVVHSTSWRYEAGRVILTYIAVVELPDTLPADSLLALPITRAELARGAAMAPPETIGVAAVIEHALRHLAWLVRDDQAIAAALPQWDDVLRAYQPEPFRALG